MPDIKRRSATEPDEPSASRHPEVLVVGPVSDHGGINQYIDEQCVRLAEVTQVSSYNVYYPPDGTGIAAVIRSLLLTVWAMVRFPFRERPDVVHVHTSYRFSFYRATPYVLMAALLWRRPIVLHVHGSSFDEYVATESQLVAGLQSIVFAATDRIVVLSQYWRDVLSLRADDDKLVVLPNAVDHDEYDPQFDVDPPRIVFVSTLIERKGVPELLEAIQSLDLGAHGARVDIAGTGPLADRVEAVAERRDAVTYWGYVSESRKRALLEESSIYVLPTHAENLPIALLEGMAGGNAVVATPVGGIPDVVGRDNGVLVDPGDVDALTDALATLVASPELVEAMARRNRELIVDEYTWDDATTRLLGIYEELVEE